MPKALTIQVLITVILPLMLGLGMYATMRSGKYLLPEFIGITNPIQSDYLTTYTPHWVLFNLLDGLWLFSFLNALLLVWRDEIKMKFIIIPCGILLSVLHELLQIAVIAGTFDILDLLAYAIAVAASFLVNKPNNIKIYEKQHP